MREVKEFVGVLVSLVSVSAVFGLFISEQRSTINVKDLGSFFVLSCLSPIEL